MPAIDNKYYNKMEAIERMAYDQLTVISRLIPYLQARQKAAEVCLRNSSDFVPYIDHLNEEIKKILSIV